MSIVIVETAYVCTIEAWVNLHEHLSTPRSSVMLDHVVEMMQIDLVPIIKTPR